MHHPEEGNGEQKQPCPFGSPPLRPPLPRADLDDAGTLTTLAVLPSGGDTSYPGMVIDDDRLLLSYYSGHEDRTAIYLATFILD